MNWTRGPERTIGHHLISIRLASSPVVGSCKKMPPRLGTRPTPCQQGLWNLCRPRALTRRLRIFSRLQARGERLIDVHKGGGEGEFHFFTAPGPPRFVKQGDSRVILSLL